jgi:hypothetical protein
MWEIVRKEQGTQCLPEQSTGMIGEDGVNEVGHVQSLPLLSLGHLTCTIYVIGGLFDGSTLFLEFSLVPISCVDHAILLPLHPFCHSLTGRVNSLVMFLLSI